MTKATWSGYLALGQVGLPVRLYNGTRSTGPHFVTLHEKDNSPVERTLRCKAEQRDITADDTVRAIEYEAGRYITLTDSELERTATHPVKTIMITQFCDMTSVNAIAFDKPYYIVAAPGGEHAYALLRDVLVRTKKAAVASYYLYRRERIGLIGVHNDLLMLFQLRFAADITPRSDLPTPPLPKPSPQEIDALSDIVERYSSPFYIEDYHDEYADKIHGIVDRKVRGLKPPRQPHQPDTPTTDEHDLLEALQKTLRAPGLSAGDQ
ncbi:MAG TPA: Ku protein [Candidatus Saccharimonadales bacterium]|nr:Ku protein [Candidatus Saccharimonadales bacterium]